MNTRDRPMLLRLKMAERTTAMSNDQSQIRIRIQRGCNLHGHTLHHLAAKAGRHLFVSNKRAAQFNKYQHTSYSTLIPIVVENIRSAPARSRASRTTLLVSSTTSAIIFPPRPPP